MQHEKEDGAMVTLAGPASAVPRARDLYLSALFRARDAGSLDGVLRIANAFAALGAHDVTVQALRMARRLPGPHPESPAISVF